MIFARPKPQLPAEPRNGLLLRGLDGTNPLGFLAALGLFRVLHEASGSEDLLMSWAAAEGTWAPVLHPSSGSTLEEGAILTTLTQRLVKTIEDHPANLLSKLDSASDDGQARRRLIQEIAAGTDRDRMDWTSALASDFAPPDSINQLQTTRRDYFFGNLSSVISRTNREHLRRAVFHPWDYSDALDNQSLHLDPSEDRRHAHQWNKPAGDPDRKTRGGMLGGTVWPWRPSRSSHPSPKRIHCAPSASRESGARTRDGPGRFGASALPPHRAIVPRRPRLQKDPLGDADIALLKAQGVIAVYRTRRILVGKTPNFTPAQCIG